MPDIRRSIEMRPLVNRQNEVVEAVCPPHAVLLLAMQEIATWGLKLAQQFFARAPRLAQSRLGEPEDLMQELIERYGEGRRIYQWPDWLFDREQPEWIKFVCFRMIGRPQAGVMASIVAEEVKRVRPTTSIVSDEDAEAGDGIDEAQLDADAASADPDGELDAAVMDVLGAAPQLLMSAIEDCAARGGFDPWGDKAVEVYRSAYHARPALPARTIASRCAVPLEFVEAMRDADALIVRLFEHCHAATLDHVADAVARRMEARALEWPQRAAPPGFAATSDSESGEPPAATEAET